MNCGVLSLSSTKYKPKENQIRRSFEAIQTYMLIRPVSSHPPLSLGLSTERILKAEGRLWASWDVGLNPSKNPKNGSING